MESDAAPHPPPDHVRHDVRMDGVFFRRASVEVPFAHSSVVEATDPEVRRPTPLDQ
ncbi:MAG TPA: hypothetical protein VGH03_09375 [Caulobacteraceae bacterium]|jgi:hypothetical protein